MKKDTRIRLIGIGFLSVAALAAGLSLVAAGSKSSGDPVGLEVSVAPKKVAPGDEVRVTVKLLPAKGIKIPRYPKTKLTVPASEGLVKGAVVSVGNDAPPPPDQIELNYYDVPAPVKLSLQVDPAAPPGKHEIPAKLRYFYCKAATGMCVPAHAEIEIPLVVKGS